MLGEDNYIDQLFKDHFEDFERSPSDAVWKGVMKEGTMANGKRFGLPAGWKSGATLLFSIVISLVLLSGSDATSAMAKEELQAQISKLPPVQASQAEKSVPIDQVNRQSSNDEFKEATNGIQSSSSKGGKIPTQAIEGPTNRTTVSAIEEEVKSVENDGFVVKHKVFDILALSYVPGLEYAIEDFDGSLTVKAKRDLNRELIAKTYYEDPKGGHWFVTGGFVLDGSLGYGSGYADGLVFGAGKYLNQNSFMQVSLRGVWDYGFTMRATYTRLLLPGKVRPFVQAGVSWGQNLDLHVGAGLMYEPSTVKNWRIYAAVNYENGQDLFDRGSHVHSVFELGMQLRLKGTEPLISDNNWMNSVPHYQVPKDWYLEGSSNFAFFDKTKVTRVSFYAGKNINKRLFARGGIRLGRDRITLPAQLQYHAVVRQKLRFGVYGGPSLDISQFGLGAEFGLIAYYEVTPGWSLFVAPVILDNSQYKDRIFETGLRYYLGNKKK